MVKTTRRCETAASRSWLSHSAHSSACFFSHDGQKDLVRLENGTT
jgi:hypothetical protein